MIARRIVRSSSGSCDAVAGHVRRTCLVAAGCTALAACSGSTFGSYGLAAAKHDQCAHQGQMLAQYLDTGQPASLAPSYGQDREKVLRLFGESRTLSIRRTANAAIQSCDQQLDLAAAESAAAASQHAAAASASASASAAGASAAQVAAKEEATCVRVGGTWLGSGFCSIDYVSPTYGLTYHYTVAFDSKGNVIPAACADAAFAGCLSQQPEPVSQAQADCVSGAANHGTVGTWHPDTDICSI